MRGGRFVYQKFVPWKKNVGKSRINWIFQNRKSQRRTVIYIEMKNEMEVTIMLVWDMGGRI